MSVCTAFVAMQKYVKDALETPVDIAVATPESLLRYRLEGTSWMDPCIFLTRFLFIYLFFILLFRADSLV